MNDKYKELKLGLNCVTSTMWLLLCIDEMGLYSNLSNVVYPHVFNNSSFIADNDEHNTNCYAPLFLNFIIDRIPQIL